MNDKNTSKNSPFYVESTGAVVKSSGYNFRPKKSIFEDVDKFFKSRFGDISKSQIMEQVVYDYYFRYAHERTYYERTIVALIHKKEMASENPTIVPLFVLNRFPKDNENDVIIDEELIENYDLMQYIAWSDKFEDVSYHMQKDIVKLIFEDGFNIKGYDVFKDLKNFNEDSLKDFFVLEIPLNNYLDAKLDGVYCFEDTHNENRAVEYMHVGLAIVKDNDKDVNATPIPLIYAWSLVNGFEVEVNALSRINLDELTDLCQRYNPLMFAVLKFFEIANFGFEDKLKKNRQQQRQKEKELEKLRQQEQELLDCMNNENGDK